MNETIKYREFTISTKILPYLEEVLEIESIDYSYDKERHEIRVPLSGNKFHELMEDAKCRLETEKCGVPTYTFKAFQNRPRFKRYRESYGCNGFVFTAKDQPLFAKKYGYV